MLRTTARGACRSQRRAPVERSFGIRCLQLRLLEGAADAGGQRLRGELLARALWDVADAGLAALLPSNDTQALLKQTVQARAADASLQGCLHPCRTAGSPCVCERGSSCGKELT